MDNNKRPQLTTSSGSPVENNQHSLTVGTDGPTLLQDFHLIDKLAHFDRERIPERVVHAKGAGAHGFFEVTDDITKFCKAKLFDTIGKKTPVFIRFSTVGGEKGSADTERDPRGFAIKFFKVHNCWIRKCGSSIRCRLLSNKISLFGRGYKRNGICEHVFILP